MVIAQAATNTTLAAALTSSKLRVHFGHVEAGLRSYDRGMPEEIYKIVVDHMSSPLFAQKWRSALNLCPKGISKHRISVIGNTVVDTWLRFSQVAARKWQILKWLGLEESQNLVLVTDHRPANVESKEDLHGIVTCTAS